MPPRRPRYHLLDLVMIVLLCGLIAGFASTVWRVVAASQGPVPLPRPRHLGTTLFTLYIAFIVWFVAWVAIRLKRRIVECRECGRRFVADKKWIDHAVCPACRLRSLTPSQMKRERKKNIRVFLIFLGIFMIALSFSLSFSLGDLLGRSAWVVLPLISLVLLGLFLLVLGLIVGLINAFIIKVRLRLLRNEKYALTRARKVSGTQGEVSTSDLLTIWHSGESNPVPDLIDQREAVRRRFEVRLGESINVHSPLRMFCFHQRRALVDFHWHAQTNLWNCDGLYLPDPFWTITLTTEVVPYRLTDPQGTARMLFGFYLLESFKGFLPRPWLQTGIVNSVASGNADELTRLNRKMVVSLSKGTAFGTELFHMEPKAVLKLLRGWYNHGNFARLSQFGHQAWSIVEYLGGEGAPQERRDRFRAFLKEIQFKQPDEPVFERHFGHGFEGLLELWKAWVQDQGIGTHELPPVEVQEAIQSRILPIIRDHQAKFMDRIQAIRDLGRVGYVVGADDLIDVLDDPGEIPREEVLWSLEAISGLVLGNDPERWRAWYSELPQEAVGEIVVPIPNPNP